MTSRGRKPRALPRAQAQPPPVTPDVRRELEASLSLARQQLRDSGHLPSYLTAALRRLMREWCGDMDRVMARKYVIEASDAGAPLSNRPGRSAAKSAFQIAAERLGRSAAWAEDAHRNRYPRKKKAGA